MRLFPVHITLGDMRYRMRLILAWCRACSVRDDRNEKKI